MTTVKRVRTAAAAAALTRVAMTPTATVLVTRAAMTTSLRQRRLPRGGSAAGGGLGCKEARRESRASGSRRWGEDEEGLRLCSIIE